MLYYMYALYLTKQKKKGKTMNNELNPVWNEHYEFVVEDVTTQHLVVRIYDDAELIGYAQVLLRELEPGKVKDVWLNLVKHLEIQRDTKCRGQVHLELLYCPFGMENGFTNPFSSNFSMTSLEKVLKNGANGTYAIQNETEVAQKKREVVNESLNPVWNQTFDFVVEDGLHDMLILEVWDHDTFGKVSVSRSIFIGVPCMPDCITFNTLLVVIRLGMRSLDEVAGGEHKF
ncbi:hypothetical protein REPUB_Repub03eG0104200 [Reevesia pubescens]